MTYVMPLRELLDTLAAHAGGDDGLPKELQEQMQIAINTVDSMFNVVADQVETLLKEWEEGGQEPDDRLMDDEEEAYINGARLASENRSLPSDYIVQGRALAEEEDNDDE